MYNSEEDNRFKTISEFKECIIRGGEPVFVWNGDASKPKKFISKHHLILLGILTLDLMTKSQKVPAQN